MLDFPPYIQLETSFVCNARCNMCVVHKADRAAFMTDVLFEKILAELKDNVASIKRVTIQFCGEPLLDIKLQDRVKRLKNIGIADVFFGTNGSLLNNDRAAVLLDSGVDQIDFSVDGSSAETFEKIRVGLSYSDVVANIKNFIEMRNKGNYDTAIRLRYTIQQANCHEVNDYLNYWKPLLGPNDKAYAKYMHNFGGDTALEELYTGEHPASVNLDDKPCISPWNSFVILSDGRVVLCCNDYSGQYVLGDLNSNTIYDIWHSKSFSDIREKHQNSGRGSMAICKGCTVWDDISQLK